MYWETFIYIQLSVYKNWIEFPFENENLNLTLWPVTPITFMLARDLAV